MSTGVKASEGILGHEYTNNRNIGLARPLAPADAVDAGSVDKLCENKRSALMMRRLRADSARCKWLISESSDLRKDGDDQSSGPNGMPPDGHVVDVLQEMNTKSID
jgi:hypothetical protein